MRRLGVVVLALALVSCDLLPGAESKGPTGTIGAIFQAASALLAPGADVTDVRLEEALLGADLRSTLGAHADTVIAHVRDTRHAADAGWKPASAAGGPKLASLAAAVGLFSVPMFAHALAESLDRLTQSSVTLPGRSTPTTTSATSGGIFTTTTVNVVETYSSNGSRVTLSMTWSYATASIENATGQTILTLSDDRTMVGGIDVCPDAVGTVAATLNVEQKARTIARGALTTRQATSNNTFAGTVGDDAFLRSVRQSFHEQSSWERTTGTGSYDVSLDATYNASQSGGLGGMQAGSVSGNIASATGQATDEGTISRSAGFSLAVDALSLDEAYRGAQRLWRNGRCVVVAAPDYSAETPIAVAEQETKQHDKEVDMDSETEFSVRLKHRFAGGNLSFALKADLTSGEKKLEPNRLESGSGSLKYKAPAEDDKKATATLRTTSKRGIGTLVLDFHTGGGLKLTINGTLNLSRRFIGTAVQIDDTVTIGPVEFKKKFENTWEGTGTWQAQTRSVTTVPGLTQTCTGSQSGTITMLATTEERGGRKVWVVDGRDASTSGTATSSCQGEVNIEAGVAEQFLSTIRSFVIPEGGGRVAINGSSGNAAAGMVTANGTVQAQTRN